MSLDNFKDGITALILVGLVLAAFALALDAFRSDLPAENACVNASNFYNSTSGKCCVNSTDCTTAAQGESYANNATTEGLLGTANATGYLSTIGTLIGVTALIAIVVGAFMFVRR